MFGLFLIAAVVPEAEAHRLIETRDWYVGRRDALLLDDRPEVRAAVKRQAVARGLMYAYQATLFDDGFGQAVTALRYVREARERERLSGLREIPDVPIQRGK